MTSFPMRSISFCYRIALIIGMLLLSSPLRAEPFKFRATQSFSFERGADVANEDALAFAATSLENRINATTRLLWSKRLDNGNTLAFAQTFEALAYPKYENLNRLTSHTEAAYRFRLGARSRWSVQLKTKYSTARALEQNIYQRLRVGATFRFHANKVHTLRFRARLGYRDQNDLRFRGFDQREALFEVGHDRRLARPGARMSTTIYAENRRADAAKFSYDEYGLRFRVKYPIHRDLAVHGGVGLYQRSYHGPFSTAIPEFRKETRVKAAVEVAKIYSDRITGFARIGWDANQSNISLRDYQGLTFGIGVTIRLN